MRPAPHLLVAQALVQPDGSVIAEAHVQADRIDLQFLLAGFQQRGADSLSAVLGQHTDGGDPGHTLRWADIRGDEADHLFVYHRLQAHHVRQGQNADQIPDRPGIFWETNPFHLAQCVQIAPGGREDHRRACGQQ